MLGFQNLSEIEYILNRNPFDANKDLVLFSMSRKITRMSPDVCLDVKKFLFSDSVKKNLVRKAKMVSSCMYFTKTFFFGYVFQM